MNTTRLHPLAEDYLVRLESAARALPSQDREELLAELRSHLAIGVPADASNADVLNLLGDLGTPEEIVAEAGAESGLGATSHPPPPMNYVPSVPASPWGALEVLAVLALMVGTFVVPILGPIVGICLAWGSSQWTTREKVIATVLTFLPLIVLVLGALAFMSTGPVGGLAPLPGIIYGGLS